MLNGFHHFAITAQNFERMFDFYCEGLGFRPAAPEVRWRDNPEIDRLLMVEGSVGRMRMLEGRSCFIELFEFEAPKGPRERAATNADRGFVHFCIEVPDIEAERERLIGYGASFPLDHALTFGTMKAIMGKDPEGNVIELLELTPGHELSLGRLHSAVAAAAAGKS